VPACPALRRNHREVLDVQRRPETGEAAADDAGPGPDGVGQRGDLRRSPALVPSARTPPAGSRLARPSYPAPPAPLTTRGLRLSAGEAASKVAGAEASGDTTPTALNGDRTMPLTASRQQLSYTHPGGCSGRFCVECSDFDRRQVLSFHPASTPRYTGRSHATTRGVAEAVVRTTMLRRHHGRGQ